MAAQGFHIITGGLNERETFDQPLRWEAYNSDKFCPQQINNLSLIININQQYRFLPLGYWPRPSSKYRSSWGARFVVINKYYPNKIIIKYPILLWKLSESVCPFSRTGKINGRSVFSQRVRLLKWEWALVSIYRLKDFRLWSNWPTTTKPIESENNIDPQYRFLSKIDECASADGQHIQQVNSIKVLLSTSGGSLFDSWDSRLLASLSGRGYGERGVAIVRERWRNE